MISVIVPVYNAEKTIKQCLEKIIRECKNLESEILVIDDASTDTTVKIIETFENIKLFKFEINLGVGHARNKGAEEAKYENLCFVDADIRISDGSIKNMLERLEKDDVTGSVSATQDLYNLNKENWSSNFVCLKSCYGVDEIIKEKSFSVCCSEFCVIKKKIFIEVGKWKTVTDAGGEEFDIGYKITQLNKKNIKTTSATYSGYWYDLYTRFIRIIQRTSKYIPLFLKKKKFDSKGSFATNGQVFSSLITMLLIFYILFSIILYPSFILAGVLILIFLQLIVEFNFLLFAKKNYGMKMVFFSLFGIQVINLGILFGVVFYIYKRILGYKL